MSRSYSHDTCKDCGGRTSNNGMGRDAHEHSAQHINGLKQRAADAPSETERASLLGMASRLEHEIDQRKARRAERAKRA